MTRKSGLPELWQTPEEIRKRLGKRAGRQRAMLADGHLLLVLHRPPKPEDDLRTGRYFWRQPDGTWSSDELGSGPKAINKHLTEYAEQIEAYDRQDEAAQSADDYFAVIYGLAPLHRAARNLHQTLQQAREMCPEDGDIINFRDRAYQIARTAELLHNDAKSALEYAVAKRAEEQAESGHRMAQSAHRLNVLAAFFFPIATLSAIFGVNLTYGTAFEELEKTYAPLPFLAVLVVGFLLGFVLKSFVTDRPRDRGKR